LAQATGLPTSLHLDVVTPEGLLLTDEVDEAVLPGELGSFGVRPGHTPFLSTLGAGEIAYRKGATWHRLTCFWGFVEVLPDKVNVLAEIGERAEAIDAARAEAALRNASERLKVIKDEAGFTQAQEDYRRAVTRLAVARRQRG
jgi:F-type H+-transporting ATPase subunit epsilon